MLRSHGISQICHTYSEDVNPIYPPLRCGRLYPILMTHNEPITNTELFNMMHNAPQEMCASN